MDADAAEYGQERRACVGSLVYPHNRRVSHNIQWLTIERNYGRAECCLIEYSARINIDERCLCTSLWARGKDKEGMPQS